MFRRYFTALHNASGEFIRDMKLPTQPPSLDKLLNEWRPDIERRRPVVTKGLRALRHEIGASKARQRTTATNIAIGLNTVGLLCDRLTVLAMKEWVLGHRLNDPEKATELRNTQINELLDSLANVRPGHSSFTQKITTLKFDATAPDWEEAYFGLLSTNMLLWEAQEVLYGGRIQRIECEELRRYIAWFSEGNILRNEYIAKSESMFWGDLAAG